MSTNLPLPRIMDTAGDAYFFRLPFWARALAFVVAVMNQHDALTMKNAEESDKHPRMLASEAQFKGPISI